MRFHLIADATFEAENIDDALVSLSEHLRSLADYEFSKVSDTTTKSIPGVGPFFDGGSCTIEKCD